MLQIRKPATTKDAAGISLGGGGYTSEPWMMRKKSTSCSKTASKERLVGKHEMYDTRSFHN